MLTIFVDGGYSGIQHAGAGAIAISPEGYFLGWLSIQLKQMTNNEAEYQAALLGLRLAKHLKIKRCMILSDSEVVVRQMNGLSRVNSARLKPLHTLTCQRVAQFQEVQFRYIRRERNQIADALASEAIEGRLVGMPATKAKGFINLWRN